MERLFLEGTAGGHTAAYLDMFRRTGVTFYELDDVIHTVKALHLEVVHNKYARYLVAKEERAIDVVAKRHIVLQYLYSLECALFSDADDVSMMRDNAPRNPSDAG